MVDFEIENAKAEPKVEVVKLEDLDRSLQTRVKLDEAAIEDYTAIVENGGELDAGIAYRLPDGRLALVAGFHRAEAYRRAGIDSMSVEIREGAEFWAIRAGVADNNRHMGVRFTSADRRKVVEMLLGKFPQYGDGLVASAAGVDRSTVVRHRRRLEEAGTCSNATSRIGADGREIAVGKIGKAKVAKQVTLTEASPSLGSQIEGKPPTPESGCTPVDEPDKFAGRIETHPLAPIAAQENEEADIATDAVLVSACAEDPVSEQPGGGTVDRSNTLLAELAVIFLETESRLRDLHAVRPGRFDEAFAGLRVTVGALARWAD